MPDDHPDPPIVDSAHLDRATFGDAGLARDLLALFLGQCDRLVPVIVAAPSGRQEAAHALLGAARAVGAVRVAALVEAIEAACARGEPDPGMMLAGDLVLAVEDVGTVIAARLDDESAREPHLAKPRRVA